MSNERRFANLEQGSLAGLKATVIGRGPVGLMCAFSLAQNGVQVRVHAKDPISEGLGFKNAAGLIEPVASPERRAARWTRDTLLFCQWAAPDPLWGIDARSVLFLSDNPKSIRQPWMGPMGWRLAGKGELLGGRKNGAWFDTHVIQPDMALQAISRECRDLAILGGAKNDRSASPLVIGSVEETALQALKHDSDFFILAPGLGLAGMDDIEDLVGMAAGLSAGMGLTIRIPAEELEPRLDHVIMDDDELGYLIPQRTHVVMGGTNHIAEHDDPAVASPHPALMNEWEAEVRDKAERLLPGSGDLKGEVLVGARPMRGGVLTHWTEELAVPGLILGGAGGSGWTFSGGIAHDVCRLISRQFDCRGSLLSLGGKPLKMDPDADLAALV